MTKIEPKTLYKLLTGYSDSGYRGRLDGWEIVDKELTGSDPEDGGGSYDLVLKHLETDKFYMTSYCDWDIDNTYYDDEEDEIGRRCDLNCRLVEVEPKEVVKTVYVKKFKDM